MLSRINNIWWEHLIWRSSSLLDLLLNFLIEVYSDCSIFRIFVLNLQRNNLLFILLTIRLLFIWRLSNELHWIYFSTVINFKYRSWSTMNLRFWFLLFLNLFHSFLTFLNLFLLFEVSQLLFELLIFLFKNIIIIVIFRYSFLRLT